MFIQKQISRIAHAIRGIAHAALHDNSFQIQVIGGALVLLCFCFYFSPFTQTEILFLALSWALVLITELQNSSFETALDRLHPELHEHIGKSKDMAAGAVFVSGLFFLVVLILVALY